jgi:hypothetical protein
MATRITVFLASLGLTVAAAQASCTKPSGSYVGSAAGVLYNIEGLQDVGSLIYTMKVLANGSWELKSWYKTVGLPLKQDKKIIPAIGTSGNTFSTATCQGQYVVDGAQAIYVVSDGGAQIQIMVVPPVSLAGDILITLRKP